MSRRVLEEEPTLPWYRRTLVGVEIGPTGANDGDLIFMSAATGKQYVENLMHAHAEYGVVFMKDQNFAYYRSRIAPKAPNLGERDLLAECISEAQRVHLPIIAYCQVQYDTSSWHAHPEWRMKDAAGKELENRLCFNSGYLEFIQNVAAEMMAYAIAGFHFDMLDFGFGAPYGCWCAVCRDLFRQRYGTEMPAGVTWDEAWERMLQFRYDSNAGFCQKLQEFVRSKRPDISVDYNYHGYPPFTWFSGERPVQHAAAGHFTTAEGLPWIFGHNNPSLLSLFMTGVRADRRTQAATSRSIYNYHDYTVRPAAELTWETLTYMAHGVQCTVVDKANYDGTIDRIVYDTLAPGFREARQKREFWGHTPLQDVALYYSVRSRDWYGRDDPTRYTSGFVGAHRALMQSHIPMGIITDENLSAQRLAEFPVVYLPHVPVLTSHEIDLLRGYVSGGGHLLVTGLTGLADRWGVLQDRCDIAELIGARFKRSLTEHSDQYVRFSEQQVPTRHRQLVEQVPLNWPLLVWGPAAEFELEGAEGIGDLMTAFRSRKGVVNMWEQLMSAGQVVGPALILHTYGKGTVLTAPFALDAAWVGDYRSPAHRYLIRNLVKSLAPVPVVRVTAPTSVETVITHDEERHRILVHLLCFSGDPTFSAASFGGGRRVLPPIMEEPMQYTARITIRDSYSRLSLTGSGSVLTHHGDHVQIQTSHIHEVLVIEIPVVDRPDSL